MDSISGGGSRRGRLRTVVASTIAASATLVSLASVATAAPYQTTAHRVGTRAQVPWQRVGSGWRVATWLPSHAAKNARATVFLISPSGHRYDITKVGHKAYADQWSPNARTVLLSGFRREIKLDLRTGHRTRLPLPAGGIANRYVLGFTRDGRGLLEDVYTGSADRVERFDLRGRLQHVFPRRVSGAGRLGSSALPLAAGRLVIGAEHGVVLFGRHGQVLRRLAPHLKHCELSSRWRKDVALARCNQGALWTIPLSGNSVRRLTDSSSRENRFGYDDAWRYSAGRLGLAENGCGPDTLVRFTANGHGRRIHPPAPIGGPVAVPAYVGHHGDIVDMLYIHGCAGGRATLFAYDAVIRTSTALLGPGVNGGSVTSEVPWFTDK